MSLIHFVVVLMRLNECGDTVHGGVGHDESEIAIMLVLAGVGAACARGADAAGVRGIAGR